MKFCDLLVLLDAWPNNLVRKGRIRGSDRMLEVEKTSETLCLIAELVPYFRRLLTSKEEPCCRLK